MRNFQIVSHASTQWEEGEIAGLLWEVVQDRKMSHPFPVPHWLSVSSLIHGNHCITRRSTGNKTNFHTHFQLPPPICHFLSILYLFIWNGNIATFLVCWIPDALPESSVMVPTSPMHISTHIRRLISNFGYFLNKTSQTQKKFELFLTVYSWVKEESSLGWGD